MLKEKVKELIELRQEMTRTQLANAGTTIKGFLLRGMDNTDPKHLRWTDAINALDDETQIEMIARLPPKAFCRVMLNISGIPLAKDSSEQKAKIRDWIKGGGLDVRRIFKEMVDECPESERDDPEFKSFESLANNGSDAEVVEFYVDSLDEDGLKKTMGLVSFFEAIEEPNPIAVVESGLLEEMIGIQSGSANYRMTKPENPFDDAAVVPNEDELIEMLNVFEFRRDEPSYAARLMATVAGKKTDLELLRMIRTARQYLQDLQGGVLDRFKLRHVSRVELEHLVQDTEKTIQRLEGERSKTSDAIGKLADRFNVPSGVTDVLAPDVYAYQLYVQRRLLSEAGLRLKQPDSANTPQDERSQVGAEIRDVHKLITQLEQDRDEQKKQHPDMEDEINRRYRKQIDALKEKL